MSAIRDWEEECLAAVNDWIRENYPGRYSGRAPTSKSQKVFDEPASLVGEYPATEIEMRFTWFGRPHVQRHPIYLEWRPESEAGPFLDAEYVAREAVTVSLHT
jgi:hypothetical protein